MVTAVSGAPVVVVVWVVGERMDSTARLETIPVRPAPMAVPAVRVVRAVPAVPAVSVVSPADRRGFLVATVSGVPAVSAAMPVPVAPVVTVVPVLTVRRTAVMVRQVVRAATPVAGVSAVPVVSVAAALWWGLAVPVVPVVPVVVVVWVPTVAPAMTRPWMVMEPVVVMPGTAVRAGPAAQVAAPVKPVVWVSALVRRVPVVMAVTAGRPDRLVRVLRVWLVSMALRRAGMVASAVLVVPAARAGTAVLAVRGAVAESALRLMAG